LRGIFAATSRLTVGFQYNMSTLKERINNDIKVAMRAQDKNKLSVLRMLNSAIKDREIALRAGKDVNLSDAQVIAVLSGEIKKRKDSAAAYERGGRGDLAGKERNEIKVLEKYLPEQMSDEELANIIRKTVEARRGASVQSFGEIMGQVMPRVAGKADGQKVAAIVKRILSG